MSIGSILVGIAAAAVVAAYLARPLRQQRPAGLDGLIEAWVAAQRVCTQCGHPARPDDRFCSRCGAELPGGVE